MQGNDDGVTVALLPIISDWSQVEFPHLTLVFAGPASEISAPDKDALSKTALSIAMLFRPVTLRTLTKDVFGEGTPENPKVDVLRFHPHLDLIKMRSMVEGWNKSSFPFNPHVTVGPVGTWNGVSPVMVAFDRVTFSVGDEHQEFRMSSGMREDW